jgi:hypothetical protein
MCVTSPRDRYKVFIIDEAHQITSEASRPMPWRSGTRQAASGMV